MAGSKRPSSGSMSLPEFGLALNPLPPPGAPDNGSAAFSTSSASLVRKQVAAVSLLVQFNALATELLTVNASSWLATGQYVLSMMALLKSLAAGGETRFAHTSIPPATPRQSSH